MEGGSIKRSATLALLDGVQLRQLEGERRCRVARGQFQRAGLPRSSEQTHRSRRHGSNRT